jgi:hypothetical protein
MKHLIAHLQTFDLRKMLAGSLVVLVVLSGSFVVQPKKAEADFDPLNYVKNSITAAESLVQTGILQSLNLKEFTLDGMAWALAKKLLAQTTRSVIDWINSGVNGKPAFITNLNEYLLTAADEAATDFIAGDNFGQLCQPLQAPLKIILDLSYQRARNYSTRSQCTLTQAFNNVSDSVDRTFDRGFSSWFELTSNPYNNIYGVSALTIGTLNDHIERHEENKKREADWGNGVMSVKDCSTGKCVIVTPGHFISEYLNFKVTVGDRVLIEADQINEIIGALFAQLGQKALSGAGGLFGLSQSEGGGAPSYTSQVENEDIPNNFNNSQFISDAIEVEAEYQAIYEKGLKDADKIALSCLSRPSVSTKADILVAEYTIEVETARNFIEALELLKTAFDASTNSDDKLGYMQIYQQLRNGSTNPPTPPLHTSGQVTEAEYDIINNDITELKDDAGRAGCL